MLYARDCSLYMSMGREDGAELGCSRQSPNFFAFFPATTTYPSMLGELYSSAFTCAAFNWICSPAVTELETIVLDWMCKLLALPSCYLSTSPNGGGGVIQGSASEAIVTVMVAARDRYLNSCGEGVEDEKERERIIAEKRAKLVALGSNQAHSSTHKASLITGVKFVTVKTEDGWKLTGKNLRETIESLKKEGLEPFYLTCTLGTTSTCAIDAFDEIAEVAAENPNIWIHVDAAYAGSALICEEYQYLTKHFEAFDSFDMNMHKWLLVNFDASCLYVKSRKPLLDALSVTPAYLRNPFTASGAVTDYRDWQIPLGRRFRALKIWFVLRTYGVNGLKAHIRKTVTLGELFTGLLESRRDLFEIIAEPRFGLNVFTVKPGNGASTLQGEERLKKANGLTKEVFEKVNAQGKIYLTSTVLDGVYAIRVVNGNQQVEEKYVRRAFDIILKAVEEVAGIVKQEVATDVAEEVKRGDLKGLSS